MRFENLGNMILWLNPVILTLELFLPVPWGELLARKIVRYFNITMKNQFLC